MWHCLLPLVGKLFKMWNWKLKDFGSGKTRAQTLKNPTARDPWKMKEFLSKKYRAWAVCACFIFVLFFLNKSLFEFISSDSAHWKINWVCLRGEKYYKNNLTNVVFVPFWILVFILCYMLAAPFFGYLGDRYNRKVILGAGIFFWSAVTLGTSFISESVCLFFWRILLKSPCRIW